MPNTSPGNGRALLLLRDAQQRELLGQLLRDAGYTVSAAGSLAEARPLLAAAPSGLVVLDAELLLREGPDSDLTAALLNAVLRQMPSGVIIAAAHEGRVLMVNEQAEKLAGVPPGQLEPGWAAAAFRGFRADGSEYHPEEWPLLRALLHGETVQDEIIRVVRADGSAVLVSASASPVRDAAGRIVAAVSTLNDVTERTREAGLLETIMEATPSWLAYLDTRLRFLRINRAFARGKGLSPGQPDGTTFRDVHPPGAEIVALAEEALRSGEAQLSREVAVGAPQAPPGADAAYMDFVLAPVKDELGRVAGLVVSATDVTEEVHQRRSVEETERARAALAERMSEEISHRVRNNLMMVTGLLHMQLQEQTDPAIIGALRDTLARILAIAEIHDMMQAASLEEVDVLHAVVKIAEATRRVFSDRAAEITVTGDPLHCHSRTAANLAVVINELLTNAIKHGAPGDDGRLHVDVRLAVEGDSLLITVWNSGDTLPPDLDLQASQGMGLRLVYEVAVHECNGSFTLTRARGGTQAEVRLPTTGLC